MGKGEISWKRHDEEGEKFEIYAHHVGNRWNFYIRQRRYENWAPLENPLLEDWLELLDGVERRVARRLMRPEEIDHVRKLIRERYPEAGKDLG
jgi:hypothetical protein